MAREYRGLTRAQLARKLALPTRELAKREQGWHYWEETLQSGLSFFTEFPVAFFVRDDPPRLGTMFLCGHDAEGNRWCHREEHARVQS
jgi:hypothetical protein